MKLYKFRPLCNAGDYERILEILEEGFYSAYFYELNDSTEGAFKLKPDDNSDSDEEIKKMLEEEKKESRICSFSTENAFSNLLMWTHYAGGRFGIAIEVEIEEEFVKEVKYSNSETLLNKSESYNFDEIIEKIFLNKWTFFKYEKEYRVIQNEKHFKNYRITKIFFGGSDKKYSKDKRKDEYFSKWKKELVNFCEKKNVSCYNTEINKKGRIKRLRKKMFFHLKFYYVQTLENIFR